MKRYIKRYICALTIILIIIFLGLHHFGVALFEYTGAESGSFKCVIFSEPIEKKNSVMYTINLNGQNFYLYVSSKTEKFEIGDVIEFDGEFMAPSEPRNYGGFDYKTYLKTKKICGSFKTNSISVLKKFKFDKSSKNNNSKDTLEKEENIKVKIPTFKIYIERIFANIRKCIKETYEKNLSSDAAGLILGLTIGNKTNLEDETVEAFRKASLSHVLAISGAHFSYIVMALNFLNKKIKRKRQGQIISIGVILFFMKLTGNTASVVRARIMSIMSIMASLLHRKNDFWTTLSLSLLIQFISNPYIIFDVGLQLSYGGVIGIVMFYKSVQNRINLHRVKFHHIKFHHIKLHRVKLHRIKFHHIKLHRVNLNRIKLHPIKLRNVISMCIAANLVIMPIMMYQFKTISFSFLISNFAATILLGPIIIIGFVSLIIRIKPVYWCIETLCWLFLKNAQICANLPMAQISIFRPQLVSLIAYYILLIIRVKKHVVKIVEKKKEKEKKKAKKNEEKKKKEKKKAKKNEEKKKKEKKKTKKNEEKKEKEKKKAKENEEKKEKEKKKAKENEEKKEKDKDKDKNQDKEEFDGTKWNINISRWDKIKKLLIATIIITNLNWQVIRANIRGEVLINFIDVGQGDCCLIRYKDCNILIDGGGDSSYDVGKNTLMPYLQCRHVYKIDCMFISHMDSDHCLGLMYVLENMKVGKVVIGLQYEEYDNMKKLEEIAVKKNVEIKIIKQGELLKKGDLRVLAIWPMESEMVESNAINNNSLVLKLMYHEFSMLFTADIEAVAEKAILKNVDNTVLKSTVLKVGHHGSKTSTTEAFLKCVSPQVAIIGVGANNKFGHPNESTLEKLKGCKVYRTDLNGEIMLKTNGHKYNIEKTF